MHTTTYRRPTGCTRSLARRQFRFERLELRLALSGFGPEDGAYIVEPWVGAYSNVEIRSSDQAIVTAGNTRLNNANAMAVQRYDALGNVDMTFGSGGMATIATPAGYAESSFGGLANQSDGKTIVSGTFQHPGNTNIAAARLTANGQLDGSFGSGGLTSINTVSSNLGSEWGTSAAIQSTGKIVVAGKSGSYGVVARVTTAGVLDSGKKGFGDVQRGSAVGYHRAAEINFVPDAYMSGFGDSVIQSDDKIVVVGSRTDVVNDQFTERLIVARYTAGGGVDSTFNNRPILAGWAELSPPAGFSRTSGRAIALQPDGKIIVAGRAYGEGTSNVLVARYTTTGVLDTTFGAGSGFVLLGIDGTNVTNCVAVQPDGKIVFATSSGAASGNVLVARLNPNGEMDESFGGSGFKSSTPGENQTFGVIEDVELQTDGSIIVAGSVTETDPTTGTAVGHPLLMRFYGDNAASAAAKGSTPSTLEMDAALMYFLADDLATATRRKVATQLL